MVEELKKEIVLALKEKDAVKASALRMLLSEVKNAQIDKADFSKEDFIEIVAKSAKKRRESIEAFKKAGRDELAEKEEKELQILSKYLPQQMNAQDLEKIVKEVVEEMGTSSMADFGKVMGNTMQKVKGRADGKDVQTAVKQVLS